MCLWTFSEKIMVFGETHSSRSILKRVLKDSETSKQGSTRSEKGLFWSWTAPGVDPTLGNCPKCDPDPEGTAPGTGSLGLPQGLVWGSGAVGTIFRPILSIEKKKHVVIPKIIAPAVRQCIDTCMLPYMLAAAHIKNFACGAASYRHNNFDIFTCGAPITTTCWTFVEYTTCRSHF